MHLRYEIIFYKDIVATEFFMNISVLPVKNLFFPLQRICFQHIGSSWRKITSFSIFHVVDFKNLHFMDSASHVRDFRNLDFIFRVDRFKRSKFWATRSPIILIPLEKVERKER